MQMFGCEKMIEVRELITFCSEGNMELLKKHIQIAERRGNSIPSIINTPTSSGQTALISACRNGKPDIVRYLVDDCGADMEQVGTVHFDGEAVEGVTPLWCAAAANYLEIVQFLVDRGADVNRTTITNSTALRAACFDGHEEVVRYLVEQGANVETPNRHEHTCLMIACFRGHENIVKYLLSRGARVNRRSAKGNTALHDCAESGNLRSLILLLRYGALMRPDEYGQTPIISGANSAYKKIVEYLSELRSPSGEFVVPVEEQAAAHELLGASLYDRQSRVQDAVIEWRYAMCLRRSHFGYTKRLPPVEEGARNHYAWSLIQATAYNAVALEMAKKKRGRGCYNVRANEISAEVLKRPPPPLPSTITADPIWAQKHAARANVLARQYEHLLALYKSDPSLCANWTSNGLKSPEQQLRSAVDAVLGVEPDFYPHSSRHIRRPLEGEQSDVTSQPQSPTASDEAYRLRYFSVSEEAISRGTVDPCEIFEAAEEKLQSEAAASQPEPLLITRLRRYSLTAFGLVREFANFAELKHVTQDAYALPLQPLLIRLRILGPDHPDTIYFLRYRGATYADTGAIPQCLAFWRYAIELQRVFLEPLSYVSQSSFLAFAELYNIVLSNRYSGLRAVRLQPSLIVDSIELAIDNIERGMEYSYPHWHGRMPWAYTSADKEAMNLHRHVRLCLHFIALLAYYFCPPEARPPPLHRQRLEVFRHALNGIAVPTRAPIFSGTFPLLETPTEATTAMPDAMEALEELPTSTAWNIFVPSESEHAEMRSKMTPALLKRFFRQVNRLVRLDPRVHEGASPLHMAASCSRLVRCDLLPLPHADLLRLLTALGADPDAKDACGYRPIGRILASHTLSESQKAELVATLVLDCGAHFDAAVMPPPFGEDAVVEKEGAVCDRVEAMDVDSSPSTSTRSIASTSSPPRPTTDVAASAAPATTATDDAYVGVNIISTSPLSANTSALRSAAVSAAVIIASFAANSPSSSSLSSVTTSALRFARSAGACPGTAVVGTTRNNTTTWPWGRACARVLALSGLRPLRHVNLQCLAARALPRSLYHRLPGHLIDFVRLHHHCQQR
ncbi:Protein fem-1 -like protein C [Echinococcus granulosus]|nr:Protein fem-1 -like protein C [Echinococcus granulosus]